MRLVNRRGLAEAERPLKNHYCGQRPEVFVVGGLLPDLLCADSQFLHAGTTDADVQVDLEVACGLVNVTPLERTLRESGFVTDRERSWRWVLGARTEVAIPHYAGSSGY